MPDASVANTPKEQPKGDALGSLHDLFARASVVFRERERSKREYLAEHQGKLGAVLVRQLGSDISVNSMLKATLRGTELKNWSQTSSEDKETLEVLGAKFPEGAQSEKARIDLAENIVAALVGMEGTQALESSRQAAVVNLARILSVLPEAGVPLGNLVEKAYMPGVNNLSLMEKTLVSSDQHFKNVDQYTFDLSICQAGLAAQLKLLEFVISAASSLEINYCGSSIRVDPKTVKIENDRFKDAIMISFERLSPVGNAKAGAEKKRESLPLNHVFLKDYAEEDRLFELLDVLNPSEKFQGGIVVDQAGYTCHKALACGTDDVKMNLKLGIYKGFFERIGVDLKSAAAEILVEPSNAEKVLFLYPIKTSQQGAAQSFLTVSVDERYHNMVSYVSTAEEVADIRKRGQRVAQLEDPANNYSASYPPISLKDYFDKNQRLTPSRG